MKDLSSFSPRRILVCQQRQIGDVLLSTPVFELLKRRFPEAELHLFTEKKCEPLLRHNPFIHAFHLIDKKGGFFRQLNFYHKVAALGFDLVIDLQQLPRCRMMTRMTHAPVRLSFPSSLLSRWRYNCLVRPEEGYASRTKVSLLAPLGIRWQGEGPRIYLLEEERRKARELLKSCGLQDGQRLIAIDSTHRRASKRWPVERFAALMSLLAGHDPSLRFLLLRGPGEDADIAALRGLCLGAGLAPEALLVPEPLPDIRLSAACLAEASLLVGNCSSPRHMAAALNVPSLVIPGASGTAWRYPSPLHRELRPALPCQPCSKTDCQDPQCLLRVTAEEAFTHALELLNTAKSVPTS
ncbi:glycosyltransferase family 9 protein [Mailhella massiliensis]|uniref:Glycosyltransferase family 9 protein n=1 Tax=Mailhella massiliensis TaxID=1903261 RepID=A0A921DR04_9BACT|nr:glycosyltransferase family 9 protein [Mailhella massiliensis]HJD96546.1 glycosyltransferase family 9 protein [Mailhella massiliensis]